MCVSILNTLQTTTQIHKFRNCHGDSNVVAPGDKRVIDSVLLTEASEGAPWPHGPTGGISTCQSIFLSLSLTHTHSNTTTTTTTNKMNNKMK